MSLGPNYQSLPTARNDRFDDIEATLRECTKMTTPPRWSISNTHRHLTSSLIFFLGFFAGSLGTFLTFSSTGCSRSLQASNIPQFAPESELIEILYLFTWTIVTNNCWKVPLKTVVFSRNEKLMGKPNTETDLYWDSLVPIGHGFVNISNPETYNLLPGIPTHSGVDRYSVAMYHQLHCLVSLSNSLALQPQKLNSRRVCSAISIGSWSKACLHHCQTQQGKIWCTKYWWISTGNIALRTLRKASCALETWPWNGPKLRKTAAGRR